MAFEKTLSEVAEIFKDILENSKLVITATSSATDVDEWDSLSHIHIVVALEKKYKIKFTTAEMKNMKNVGDLVQIIESKLA
jgi:acyl carrier protein